MKQTTKDRLQNIAIAALAALLVVFVWGQSATGLEARGVRERISINASEDAWLYNGSDIIFYSDDHSTEVARIDGATGNITSAGTIVADGVLDLNGLADGLVLDADADTTISAPTDDQIDIEIAGADDFSITANAFNVLSGSSVLVAGSVDFNGVADALILDADADTTISAPTDDQIDVEIAGADDFTFTANTFTGLTGSAFTNDIFTTAGAFASADSAATNEYFEIAGSTPVDTTGANTHNFLTVDAGIGAATGGTNNAVAVQIDAITDDAQVVTKALQIGDEWNYAIDTAAPVVATAQTWFDDFLGDAVLSSYTEINGADAQAVQAIAVEQFGVYSLTSGDVGDTVANDMEAVHLGLEWQADQGSLIFEVRLHIDTAVTTAYAACGLTDDSSTAELVATVAGADAITTNASNAVAFVFDTRADTDEWFAIGVATDVDATGNAATGTAPVADTYQVLRIEVDSGGADARFYINGTLVGTLTASAVTNTVALSPFCQVYSADAAASVVLDIDYLFVAADRD